MNTYYNTADNQRYGFDNDQLHLVTATMIKLTDEQIQGFINDTINSYVDGEFVYIETQTIEEVLSMLKTKNAQLRDKYFSTTTEYKEGYTLKAKKEDIGTLTAFLMACQLGIQTTMIWYYSNEVHEILIQSTAVALAQWIQDRLNKGYAKEAEINTQLDACTTVTELKAIDLEVLWNGVE